MSKNEELFEKIMSLSRAVTWERSVKLSRQSLSLVKEKIDLGSVEFVYLVGCGSSLASAYVGEAWIEHIARIPAKAVPAYQFLNYTKFQDLRKMKALVIGVSAGGSTGSVESALHRAREEGVLTLAVTGVGDPPCAMAAEAVIFTDSMNESRVPARTSSYIDILLGLFLFSIELGRVKGNTSEGERLYWEAQLTTVIKAAEGLPDLARAADAVAESIFSGGANHAFVLGTGPNRGTMEEGALKIVELSWIVCCGEETEDFIHGRFREADQTTPMMIIAPKGASTGKVMDVLTGCQVTRTPTIVLTDHVTEALGKLATHIIKLPDGLDEYSTPMLYVIPIWLLGYRIAILRGIEAGTARHGLSTRTISFVANYDDLGEKKTTTN